MRKTTTCVYPEGSGAARVLLKSGPAPYFHRSDCNICRQQDGLKSESELLDAPRPNGHVIEGEHFLAEHGPLQSSSPGTVIVQVRRHLLDFGDMRPVESGGLGSFLHRLKPRDQGCHRTRMGLLLGIGGASGALPSQACTEEGRRGLERSGPFGEAAPSCVLAQRRKSDVGEDQN
jgi:hypothetical protein